jgi:hypothetical protein
MKKQQKLDISELSAWLHITKVDVSSKVEKTLDGDF